MTVYRVRRYWEDDHYCSEPDPVADSVVEVWEVAGAHRWSRQAGNPAIWVPDGEDEPIELEWHELLRDFYAVTDDRAEALILLGGCPVCGPSGCTGHTRVVVDA